MTMYNRAPAILSQPVLTLPKGLPWRRSTGAAYIYQRTGTVWSEELKLNASDGEKDDFYGEGVSIDGDVAVVGTPQDDDAGSWSGSVYV